jgi:hypothetical protein
MGRQMDEAEVDYTYSVPLALGDCGVDAPGYDVERIVDGQN